MERLESSFGTRVACPRANHRRRLGRPCRGQDASRTEFLLRRSPSTLDQTSDLRPLPTRPSSGHNLIAQSSFSASYPHPVWARLAGTSARRARSSGTVPSVADFPSGHRRYGAPRLHAERRRGVGDTRGVAQRVAAHRGGREVADEAVASSRRVDGRHGLADDVQRIRSRHRPRRRPRPVSPGWPGRRASAAHRRCDRPTRRGPPRGPASPAARRAPRH